MGCSGPFASARPSIVSTSAPSTCQAKTVQDFTALPSTWTTQAPHCEVSQPTWVPVSRRCSRRNCTRRVRGSTSPVTALPFTVIATADMGYLLKNRPKRPFLASPSEAGDGSGRNRSILPRGCPPNKGPVRPEQDGQRDGENLPPIGRGVTHGSCPPPRRRISQRNRRRSSSPRC